MGLPTGARRRTPGLRREELAKLCGISVTWYTWIEQGRDVSVSASVLARLATVLSLARAERHYLFELAACADPEHGKDLVTPLPARLAVCVHSLTAPAYILDHCWNVLARNAALLRPSDGRALARDPPDSFGYFLPCSPSPRLFVGWG